MVGSDIGIDLGTASILVYIKGKGVVLKEPSVVAFDRDTNKIKAIGEEARLMLGRTPGNIVAVRPLRQGVISDYTVTEKMIKHFIQKALGKKSFRKPLVSVCVPSGVTEVEKKAVEDATFAAGARDVKIIEEPIAAAIGAGIDISKPCGNMIVDIGGGTSDIAVISLGGTADSTTTAGSEANDKVTISKNDKPYLSLGADLTPDQRATVLGFMGIELTDLDKYDVVYVNNDEEHKYLDSYISKSEIGTRSLSSVLITEDKKGAGLSVSTHNINYCTVGMYKNALATAGIADAKIIVAGPFPISGTAALVGTLKAYEEMTGKKLDDKVTDAAMDELVTTGELNKSIDGDSQDIEAMIADLKKQLADGRLKDESQIKDAIKEAAKDYDLKLSDDDIAKLTSLLMKLKDANIDWDSVINQAQDWASKLGDKINDSGFWEKLGNFFMDLWDKIKSLFS